MELSLKSLNLSLNDLILSSKGSNLSSKDLNLSFELRIIALRVEADVIESRLGWGETDREPRENNN